jgi:hypothetical protein
MVTTVRSRPNHYERLGLDPSASGGEIAQAFARKMSAPRAMTDVAQLGIAYATLRDPARRQAYDRSIGLSAPPEPRAVSVPMAQPRWTPFIIRAAANGSEAASSANNPSEPHVEQAERSAQQEFASTIGRSLHELAKPTGRETPTTSSTEPEPEPHFEPQIDFPAVRHSRATGSREGEGRTIDWKYPAFAIGSLILAVGLLGGWAGMSAGGDAEAAQADPELTVALPKARENSSVRAAAVEPVETGVTLPLHATAPLVRDRRAAKRQRPKPLADEAVEGSTVAATDPLAPESAPKTEAVSASMPLPNAVIARTIERIGYSCGEVASTTTVDGSAGVYRVTCSSGQSYQASPVGGRYRFRRSH